MQRLLSGKWTLLILCFLRKGPLRFSELLRYLPDLTQATLTKHLRKLEEDDLVLRTVYPEVPPKVEYSLTESGRKLFPVMDALGNFGIEYIATHAGISENDICSDIGKQDCRCHIAKR